MSTRIYLVKEVGGNNDEPSERLVRAGNQAQAVKHVVGKRFTAKVATQDDLARMLPEGAEIVSAGESNSQVDIDDV